MNRQLKEIGTIPVTTSVIESLYPELKSADKKVVWLEKNGYIIRLKRDLILRIAKQKPIYRQLRKNKSQSPIFIGQQ